MRPAPLCEVAGAQRCDRTVRGTSLGAPSLAAPQLAANETLDSATLSFLLNRALEEKEKEEEERRKREEEQVKRQDVQEEALLTKLQAERDALLALASGPSFPSRRNASTPPWMSERRSWTGGREEESGCRFLVPCWDGKTEEEEEEEEKDEEASTFLSSLR